MKYTTDQAIALAREVWTGIALDWKDTEPRPVPNTNEELTALCNKVRSMALLEAAKRFEDDDEYAVSRLIRMAGVE